MKTDNIAIEVNNLSKLYRIGSRQSEYNSAVSAAMNFFKSPINNYRRYRSLYRFSKKELDPDADNDRAENSDLIWALKNVSLSVKKGEVLGIIGRNGAGKSTLLKVLSRITYPTTGRAEIRGRVASLLEVGTGFHQELTGRENIYLNGTVLGMKKSEIDARFAEIIAFSGVEKFIDTPVKRYSSGMKVRLAFSVAAHLEPEVLIVDEVLAVGDMDFQRKCLDKMEDVGRQGRTIIFVSHNMPAITRMCDRAVLLEEGCVVAHGTVNTVVGTYLNANHGRGVERVWQDVRKAPQGDAAILRAVRLTGKDKKIEDVVDIRKPFQIEMEYDVIREGHVLLPHFGLRNAQGQVIFITVDQDPNFRGKPRAKGRYRSRVEIPGNLLSEGTVFVNCHLFTMEPYTRQFKVPAAVVFEVVDTLEGNSARGDYAKHMPGVIRPLLTWQTEYKPSSGL